MFVVANGDLLSAELVCITSLGQGRGVHSSCTALQLLTASGVDKGINWPHLQSTILHVHNPHLPDLHQPSLPPVIVA